MCLLKYNYSWVPTHSLAHLQDLIPIWLHTVLHIIMPAKVGIKSCICAREYVLLVVYVVR